MHDPISTSFNHYRAKIKWMYVCMSVCLSVCLSVYVCITEAISPFAWLLQHNLFVQFRASERERKQLSLLRHRVFQEELFFTLRKALAM